MFKIYRINDVKLLVFICWMMATAILIRPYGSIFIPVYRFSTFALFLYSVSCTFSYWRSSTYNLRKIYLILLGFMLFLILSRVFNGDTFDIDIIMSLISYVTPLNLFTFGLTKNKWSKLKGVAFMLLIYAILNFISIVQYPDGLYANDVYSENWLLGFKNVMIRTLLPCVVINVICSLHDYNKLVLKDYLLLLITILSVIMVESTTSLLVIVVFIFAVAYLSIFGCPKYYNLIYIFTVTSILSVLVTFFSIGDFLGGYLERYFDKDATFTGRIFMWAYSYILIPESPIYGYGWHVTEEWRDVINLSGGMNDTLQFSHPHNYVLYILLQGGILYLVLHIYLYIYITKNVIQYNNRYILILITMYLAFFIEGITESLTGAVLLIPMYGLFVWFSEERGDNINLFRK